MNYFNFKNYKNIDAPWSQYYEKEVMELNIENISLYNFFEKKTVRFGNSICLDYYEKKIRFNELLDNIDICAKALYSYGVRKNDIVTLCLPNTLEGIVSFLAINKIGAITNFIHPVSGENELKDVINDTNSKVLIVIDNDYLKVENIISKTGLDKVIIVSEYTYMSFLNKLRYHNNKVKIKITKNTKKYMLWHDFIESAKNLNINKYKVNGKKDNPAIILRSGGTTGIPKGVVLSNGNLIAFIKSVSIGQSYLKRGDTCLALMPIFHGFGIMHSIIFPLTIGMNVILRPKFEVKEYCFMIKKYHPQILMGVPSLFESLLKEWNDEIDLDFLKCVLVGGDALKKDLRDKINKFLKRHNSHIKVSEGYGLSEAVCGVVLGNPLRSKNDTIGIPLPGIYVGIFNENNEAMPYGEMGEICVCGPTVMLGYYNNEKETNMALRIHKDNNIWLHTGDIGSMDKYGYITFVNRLKRIIISSGYNVYPSQIEKLIETHPSVMQCTVVGVPHKRKIEVPKAYIVLKNNHKKRELITLELMLLCKKNLPKYSWPFSYEYVKCLPTTAVGKINFKELQEKRTNDSE